MTCVYTVTLGGEEWKRGDKNNRAHYFSDSDRPLTQPSCLIFALR
ncbi:MAG: hypothetical protein ACYT04_08465 [Nostoc sp.]